MALLSLAATSLACLALAFVGTWTVSSAFLLVLGMACGAFIPIVFWEDPRPARRRLAVFFHEALEGVRCEGTHDGQAYRVPDDRSLSE